MHKLINDESWNKILDNILETTNKEIENDIEILKEKYDFKITNEILKDFCNLTFLSIEKYHEKYNIFNDMELVNLVSFLQIQYFDNYPQFNLIKSILYDNKYYIEFEKTLPNDYKSQTNIIIELANIINFKIQESFGVQFNGTPYDNEENVKNVSEIEIEDIAPDLKRLIQIYLYLYKKENAMNKIEKELKLIKKGHCEILERFYLFPNKTNKLTNSAMKTYFKFIDNNNLLNTLYCDHKTILEYLKENKFE